MSEQLISAIRIEGLFGLYTYRVPNEGELSNAAILYGDNGIGKSTILRLAFHLLSPSENRHHRSLLFTTPFRKLEVDLAASQVTLTAERMGEDTDGPLALSIAKNGEVLAEWKFKPKGRVRSELVHSDGFVYEFDDDGKIYRQHRLLAGQEAPTSVPQGERAYLGALAAHVPTAYILNADRRLDSDAVPDPGDEVELRRVMRFEEHKRIQDLVSRSREIALSQALNAASKWISGKAFQSANRGSVNVHRVYIDVLRHIGATNAGVSVPSADSPSLIKRLSVIEAKSQELARYEFAAKLSTIDFKKTLSAKAKAKRELAVSLLTPYVESLEGRFNALDEIYKLVDKFVSIVNGFLSDKSISYRLSGGFVIQNRLGNTLTAAQLSSGEQQLLLLFCYVLTSRDSPSVFMIDEPEISLNIKWQRQLVQSLLDITGGATIQFIFATHSLELLAQHRSRVVQLVPTQ